MSTAILGEVWRSTSAEQVLHLGLVEETGHQGDFIGRAERRSSENIRGNDPKCEGPTTGVSQEVTAPTFTGIGVVQKHNYFLKKRELFIKSVCNIKTQLICGDINVDYLLFHNRRQQLDTLLASYNLTSIVDFPTRIAQGSCTAIDNFFINVSQNYLIQSLVNGISDHDAQLLILKNIIRPTQKLATFHIKRFQ
jgi:hypothetical protein